MTYDIIVVGAGPAGITAAIYARRANKSVLVIERSLVGGQVATIGEIENYPGFLSIQGPELAETFSSQAKKLGIEFKHDNLLGIEKDKNEIKLNCKKQTYQARAVILALGSISRELNVEGEKDFLGKGVSYCATCDGFFFKGKEVVIVGSGDSAVSTALYLLPIAKKVSIVSKYQHLKLKAYTDAIFERLKNVEILGGANVQKIIGSDKVEAVKIDTVESPIPCQGIFVTIGRKPDTEFLRGTIDLDEKGYIKTDELMKTSMPNVYACGDVVVSLVKQIVTAAAGGAIAATSALKSL